MAIKEDLDDMVNGLPSPITPVSDAACDAASGDGLGSSPKMSLAFNSPSRKVSKALVNSENIRLTYSIRPRRLLAMPSLEMRTMKKISGL